VGLFGNGWRRHRARAEAHLGRQRWARALAAARRARARCTGGAEERAALDALLDEARHATLQAKLAAADAFPEGDRYHPRRFSLLTRALDIGETAAELAQVLERYELEATERVRHPVVVRRGDVDILASGTTTFGLDVRYLEDAYLAAPWLDALLQARLGVDADMVMVADGQRMLRRALVKRGWSVCGVTLLGEVGEGLRRLQGSPDPRSLGVEVRPLSGDAERDAVFALHERVLGGEPELLPRGYSLDEHLADMRAERSTRDAIELVVTGAGGVVGHVGAALSPHNPVAGVVVILDRSHRGRGLLRPLYRALFEALNHRGISYFSGYTEHPAVIHVGRALGRKPISVYYAADGHPAAWWRERVDQVWW